MRDIEQELPPHLQTGAPCLLLDATPIANMFDDPSQRQHNVYVTFTYLFYFQTKTKNQNASRAHIGSNEWGMARAWADEEGRAHMEDLFCELGDFLSGLEANTSANVVFVCHWGKHRSVMMAWLTAEVSTHLFYEVACPSA